MSVCGLQIQDMFEGDIGINARPSSRITFSTAAMTVFNMQEQMSSKKKWRDYFFLQCRAQTTNLNNKLQWFFIFFFFFPLSATVCCFNSQHTCPLLLLAVCEDKTLSFPESRNYIGPYSIYVHPASSSLYLLESVQSFYSFCSTRQCQARAPVNKILQNLKCWHV